MLTTFSTNNSTRSSNTNTNMPTTSSTNNDISSYFNNTNLPSSNNNYLPSLIGAGAVQTSKRVYKVVIGL